MHVTVIAKAPVAGQVKTRLSPPCTPEQAAQVAAAALADTLAAVDEVARRSGARRVLLLEGERQEWMPAAFDVVAQRGDGLEQRLCNGFVDLGPGVIIGMETPHVTASLADAIAAARHGVDTIGLATDGGYWMIGLCAASVAIANDLFDGVPMSRTHTGLAQLRRMHSHGRQVRLLPMARDLDTIADLAAIAESGRTGSLATLAARVLADIL
ncbi:MAG TPA: DUF2064 domain-containing protein [Ilumatobacteraceae bacterium]|nr:DUF2064 domain-containing protein [Ilumatobacteraceae bacterium]